MLVGSGVSVEVGVAVKVAVAVAVGVLVLVRVGVSEGVRLGLASSAAGLAAESLANTVEMEGQKAQAATARHRIATTITAPASKKLPRLCFWAAGLTFWAGRS